MRFIVDLNNLILIVTFLVNFGLGAFIYFRDRKNETSRVFGSVLFLISFWTFSFLMFSVARDPSWVLFWRRITPVGSALVAGYFLYFSLLFPRREAPLLDWQRLLIVFPGYVFAGISIFTPWMVNFFEIFDVDYPFLGVPHFGPAYRFYAFYLILFFITALLILTYKLFKAVGREKLQIFYVLMGMGLSILCAVTVSLFYPIFGMARLFTTGPPFTLILAGFIAYAIIRHRLLNIENFLFRALVFLTAIAVIAVACASMIMGNILILFFFSLALVQLALGFYVLFQNFKNEINLSFALFCVSLSFWTVAVFMLQNASRLFDVVLWGRYIYVGPSLIVYFFLYFTMVFPRKTAFPSGLGRFILFIPTMVLLVLVPGPWILKGAALGPQGPTPLFGQAYFLFALYFVIYFIYGIFNLIKKNIEARGLEKIQVRYVLFGLSLSFLFGMITNLVLPAFGEARFFNLGPFFTLFLIGFTAYAIVKHRLMSIEIVIQRGAAYGIASIFILVLYALAVIISETFLRNIIGYSSILITAGAALLIAVLYQPIVHFIQVVSDRIFFRGRYDYQKTLKQVSHAIASFIRLDQLTYLIVSTFIETMKVSEISFLLLDSGKQHYRSVALEIKEKFSRYKKIEIDSRSPIATWLISFQDILVKDEIEDEIARQETLGTESRAKVKSLEEVKEEMDHLGIGVWVPIISKGELIGIIALGSKLSGEIFTSEDLGLLNTLASQTALALDNVRLYEEVVTMRDYSKDILQSMTNGVLTTDMDGRIITFNYMAEKITGKKIQEVLGNTCEQCWGPRGAITAAIKNTLKDRCYINFETSLASPEKGLVPVSFSSTLLRDSRGNKMGALLSIQDLSEVKVLEDQIRRADKLKALATMAAGMAHEIKNPLSSMKVLSQLMPLKFDDPEYRQKFGEIMPREIGRIDRIVESLLGFARATAPKYEKIDLKKLLEEIIGYFKDQAKDVEVKIISSLADLPLIEVDKGQITQVFTNLILNAIQAMPGGGEIRIAARAGRQVDNVVQDIIIKVSDTGPGMSEETVRKLFDPFFTTKHGGTGLGLTITHNIVDGHKGSIDVESEPGKGTLFRVTLPVSQNLL